MTASGQTQPAIFSRLLIRLQAKPLRDPTILWLGVGLITAFFLSRLIGLVAFPAFLDEAVHVRYAEAGFQASPLVYASEGRLFTLWWYMLFQPHLAGSIWIIRAATLLAVLPGFAACLALGRLMAGRWGFLLAGLFYLFSTYHTFFDRLGLADPIAASAITLALYLGLRTSRTANTVDAVLLGIALFLGIGAKVSVLPYAVIPIIAGLTLFSKRRSWRSNIRWVVIALATEGLLTGGLMLALRLLHYDLFSLIGVHNQGTSGFSLNGIMGHIADTTNLFMAYAGPLVFILLLLSILVLLIQRRWYLVLCLIGPLLVVWLNRSQYSRFFILSGTILLLCGAIALATLIQRQRNPVQWLTIGAVLIYGLIHWFPFAWTVIHNPAELALAPADRQEYIRSDAGGFGLAEVHVALRNQGAREVIGLLSNCTSLRFLSQGDMKITCPRLNPDGSNLGELEQLIAANRRAGVYVVLEDNPFVPKTVSGNVRAVIPRPNDGPHLTIIELTP
jgi:hypothetical protein